MLAEGCCPDVLYDLYQNLQLHFDIPLMMGAIDARNMLSTFALNKYLHTAASFWILLIWSYDARNREYTYMLSRMLQFISWDQKVTSSRTVSSLTYLIVLFHLHNLYNIN